MSSATFNPDTKKSAVTATAAMLTSAVLLGLLGLAFISVNRQKTAAGLPGETVPAATPEFFNRPADAPEAVWTPFFRKKSTVHSDGLISDSYRLAGTYFEFGESTDKRRAIVDQLANGKQHIVSEGQILNDLLILSIANDNILIRNPAGTEERLWLSFRSNPEADQSGSQSEKGNIDQEGPADAFGGRRVGENRWVFEREKLVGYYADLMSDPERMLKVFDSLMPVYTTDGSIEGYQLEVFGEKEFFQSTGLEAGDIVRSVNSIDMTNRRRAEYLISEFVNNRINVIVMDIERNGEPSKFIYQIR